MNMAYWAEQMKATVAIAAHLAVPAVTKGLYLPVIIKAG